MSESVAIVTGASQGIGRATAERLAKDFYAVACCAERGGAQGSRGERQVEWGRAANVSS
jgi:3-oxoacyl-[acyl-carrier protein] reductase